MNVCSFWYSLFAAKIIVIFERFLLYRMRKISADILFPVTSNPIENGVLVLNNNGTIIDVLQGAEADRLDEVEKFSGVLCPGFVNTHCHLELSHLKGKIKQGTSLPVFIEELQQIRKTDEQTLAEAISEAENEMRQNGIVAVADIANGSSSFFQKSKQNLYYHTFMEVFGFNENQCHEIYEKAEALCKQYSCEVNKQVNVTPHAPYSVSLALLQKIVNQNLIFSIHNQESEEENKMFIEGEGLLIKMLKKFGIKTEEWNIPQQHSLPYLLEHIKKQSNILLVHNTFTSANDIEAAMQSKANIYWCFCPNANLYIEKVLPDIPAFVMHNCKITLGTDSLASNHHLSILEEIKTIKNYFPSVSYQEMLKWGTINGAEFLGIQKRAGSLEKGKKPGVLLIDHAFTKVRKIADAII